MNFELYGDDSAGVVKLDPRTKMLIFLSCAITSINMYNDRLIAGYIALLCLILGLCGKRILALKAFAAFAAVFFLRFCVQMQGTGASVAVTLISVLLTVFVFMFPMVVSLLLLIQTTRIGQFLAAFQAMHLPAAAVIPVAVLFRFIPTVADERAGISKAMAFRGIEVNMANVLRHPAKAIEHTLVPLLFSSVDVMEELAAASEARGLSTDLRRTSLEEVRLRPMDYAVMVGFATFAVYMIACSFKGITG